ncbi:hypothetical protein Q7P37_001505 [Cladosporium fusiforme]
MVFGRSESLEISPAKSPTAKACFFVVTRTSKTHLDPRLISPRIHGGLRTLSDLLKGPVLKKQNPGRPIDCLFKNRIARALGQRPTQNPYQGLGHHRPKTLDIVSTGGVRGPGLERHLGHAVDGVGPVGYHESWTAESLGREDGVGGQRRAGAEVLRLGAVGFVEMRLQDFLVQHVNMEVIDVVVRSIGSRGLSIASASAMAFLTLAGPHIFTYESRRRARWP